MKWSTMDCFENVAAIGSWIERLDEAYDMRYKTHLIAPVGLRSNDQDAPSQI